MPSWPAHRFARADRARRGGAPLPARHALLPGPPRLREEPDSDHRTPFQRDRDRIVHSKAFRRLKHKTQVFIAPEGDHYRTRLTHTLETCGIARTVARALGPQRGPDRGDRARPRPRPPALRPHRRGGARRVRARALGARLPPQRALAAHGRARSSGLNLTEQVRDGILHHTGPEPPATLEGRIVRAGRPDRLHQPRHRRRDPRRRARASSELPARGDRAARRRPARSGSRRSWSTCSTAPSEAGDIVAGGGSRRRDASPARVHVRAGLPRAGGAAPEAAHRAHAARAVRPLRSSTRRRR